MGSSGRDAAIGSFEHDLARIVFQADPLPQRSQWHTRPFGVANFAEFPLRSSNLRDENRPLPAHSRIGRLPLANDEARRSGPTSPADVLFFDPRILLGTFRTLPYLLYQCSNSFCSFHRDQ
jgi:hypothetical protein